MMILSILVIISLINNKALRFRLAALGRKRLQEQNTTDQLSERILSKYQSVVLQSKKQVQFA